MTEHEWDRSTDPQKMLEFLRDRRRQRQLRLFAVACCRRVLHLLPRHKSIRTALELAERRAEGLADWEQVRRARHNLSYGATKGACMRLAGEARLRGDAAADLIDPAHWAIIGAIWDDMYHRRSFSFDPGGRLAATAAELASLVAAAAAAAPDEERATHCVWLRDLFGPLPFRTVTSDAAWLRWNDGTVQKLAQSLYDNRRFGDLPILADALEEAGCSDAELLAHLRGPGPHARGCWVVDALLGKQ